jgi:hypothetical protein
MTDLVPAFKFFFQIAVFITSTANVKIPRQQQLSVYQKPSKPIVIPIVFLSSAKSFVLFISSLHSPAINKILVETVLEKYFNNAVIETKD